MGVGFITDNKAALERNLVADLADLIPLTQVITSEVAGNVAVMLPEVDELPDATAAAIADRLKTLAMPVKDPGPRLLTQEELEAVFAGAFAGDVDARAIAVRILSKWAVLAEVNEKDLAP